MDKEKAIKWRAVLAIAGIQGIISLTWMIYDFYLPELLGQLGMAAGVAGTLLIGEKLLAAVVEPASGLVSDQNLPKWGSRYPLIIAGMLLSAVAFFAIPLLSRGEGSAAGKSFFLLIVILWAGAMSLFRSPTLVLLGRYAKNKELTEAYSVVLLTTGLFAALKQYSKGWILGMGPLFAFGLGSATLLLGMVVLWYVIPAKDTAGDTVWRESSYKELKNWYGEMVLIFVVGIFVALGVRFVTPTVKGFIVAYLPQYDSTFLFFCFLLLLAVAAIPATKAATKFGNIQAMLIGAIATGVTMLLFVVTFHPIWLIFNLVALVSSYSIVLNGPVPMALSVMPKQWGSFGIGLFYGGFSLAMVIFNLYLQPQLSGWGNGGAAVGGSLSFLIAAAIIWGGDRMRLAAGAGTATAPAPTVKRAPSKSGSKKKRRKKKKKRK